MANRSDTDRELADAFVTASRALVAIAVRSIQEAPDGLTVQQHRILMLLRGQGGLTVGEIAELSGVNQSNASRVCDRLQKLDLVRRQRSGDDARMVRVEVTTAGRRVVDAVTRRRRREVAVVLERMSDDDARAAVAALAAFNAAAQADETASWLHVGW